MTYKKDVTFGLIPGSWHGAWCWKFLQEELDKKGYKSVAIDIPCENPQASFDDYADVVVDKLENEFDLVLVGHSRGGNVIPRAATRLDAKQMIFLCSSFEPATIGHPKGDEDLHEPQRNSQLFQDGIIYLGGEMTTFDPELSRQVLYHDCSKDIQDWAIDNLKPQRRSDNEPTLQNWPDIPLEYIICSDDRAISSDWSHYVCDNWLKVKPRKISAGHMPMMSRPKQLADLLVELV